MANSTGATRATCRSAGDTDRTIGRLIRARRKASGLSIEDLATAAGVSFQQMQKYEVGRDRIAASRLVKIAGHLGTAPADLLPTSA